MLKVTHQIFQGILVLQATYVIVLLANAWIIIKSVLVVKFHWATNILVVKQKKLWTGRTEKQPTIGW